MISESIDKLKKELPPQVTLVAVSKFHPLEEILEAYSAGQRLFGENRPQELEKKVKALAELPSGAAYDPSSPIEWHFLGHLQTNKLKMVLPYASMVQSVDSLHLLKEIEKWGKAAQKVTDVLLELHIGAEETKQGFHEEEVLDILFDFDDYHFVRFRGLMGMASNSDDEGLVRADFQRISSFFDYLRDIFPDLESFDTLSIGMSEDYPIALDCGSTMVRIGTAIFGPREY